MATITYGKYFGSVIVTTGTTTDTNNWSNVGRSWEQCLDAAATTMGGFGNGHVMSISNSHDVPTNIYSGEFYFTITFYTSNGAEMPFELAVGYIDGSIDYNECIDNRKYILAILNQNYPLTTYSVGGFYFSRVQCINVTFRFSNSDNKIFYTPSCTELTNNPYDCVYTLDKNAALRKFICTMNVTNQTIDYTTTSHTFRNLTPSGTAAPIGGKTVSYRMIPTGIDDNKINTFYKQGYACPTVNPNLQANHQEYIPTNARVQIGKLKNRYSISGKFNAQSTNTVSKTTLATFNSNDVTYAITWMTSGYDFYRNSALSQNIATYNTFSGSGSATINIYPKPISQICHDTFVLMLYDVDEGVNSCTDYSVGDFDRYNVPPTDIIKDYDYETLAEQTLGTYSFCPSSDGGFSVLYNGQLYEQNQTSPEVTPRGRLPYLASVSVQTSGETFPYDPTGWVMNNAYNRVLLRSGQEVVCSVRYHLTGDDYIVSGPKHSIGSNTYERTIIYYVGVKKNDLKFIDSIVDYNPYGACEWSDFLNGGTNYTMPIAYANKVSTMYDLFEKMTCLHGAAMDLWIEGGSPGENTLYDIRSRIFDDLWSGILESKYENDPVLLKSRRMRQISFTYAGTRYNKYEYNWPIRYKYNYPIWSDPNATSFTYINGLAIKNPATNTDDIIFCHNLSETFWNDPLTNGSTKSTGTTYAMIIDYNGYQKQVGVSIGNITVSIYSHPYYNKDNRAISNTVITQYQNLALTDRVYDWIQNDTSYFDGHTSSSYQRAILGAMNTEVTGYTFSLDANTIYGYNETGYIFTVGQVIMIYSESDGSFVGYYRIDEIYSKEDTIYVTSMSGAYPTVGPCRIFIPGDTPDSRMLVTNDVLYTQQYEI